MEKKVSRNMVGSDDSEKTVFEHLYNKQEIFEQICQKVNFDYHHDKKTYLCKGHTCLNVGGLKKEDILVTTSKTSYPDVLYLRTPNLPIITPSGERIYLKDTERFKPVIQYSYQQHECILCERKFLELHIEDIFVADFGSEDHFYNEMSLYDNEYDKIRKEFVKRDFLLDIERKDPELDFSTLLPMNMPESKEEIGFGRPLSYSTNYTRQPAHSRIDLPQTEYLWKFKNADCEIIDFNDIFSNPLVKPFFETPKETYEYLMKILKSCNSKEILISKCNQLMQEYKKNCDQADHAFVKKYGVRQNEYWKKILK